MKKLVVSLFSLALIWLTACKKDETPLIDDFAAPKAYAIAESVFNVVYDLAQEEISKNPNLNGGFNGGTVGTCPTVTFTPKNAIDSFPATLRLDFGTGCTTAKGHTIAGTLTATISGRTNRPNATISITLANLKVNGTTISGTLTATTTGALGQAQQNLTLQISNATCTTSENATTTINSLIITRTQVAGQNTTVATNGSTALNDDAFDMTIEGSGTNSEGKTISISTTAPLRRDYTCRWFKSGTMDIKAGLITAKLDFGANNCDNKLDITVGNQTKTVDMP